MHNDCNFRSDHFTDYYLNINVLDEFDKRIHKKLTEEALSNETQELNYARLQLSNVPSAQKIIDLSNKEIIYIAKVDVADFLKTCQSFGLFEMEQFVEVYFTEDKFYNNCN